VEAGGEQEVPLEQGPSFREEREQGRIVEHAAPLSRAARRTAAFAAEHYTVRVTPLSAVVITKDEEGMLAPCLESLSFCDELLVVDSGSTDRTREIAATAGARVLVNVPWPGFAAQRNFGFDAARHDWILFADADERVTPELRDEVRALARCGFSAAGYRMPRVAFYLGRWIRATDWYPDWKLRLFDRRRGRCREALVHESVSVRGAVGRLRGELLHYPYRDVADHVRTIDEYTTLWSHEAHAAGRRAYAPELLLAPAWALLRNYLLRGGVRLGRAGWTISVLNSYYTFLKIAKLIERQAPARPSP
jgi:glycosyltransferase involved in cell wall biosynthesis